MNSAWRFSFILMMILSLDTRQCWAAEEFRTRQPQAAPSQPSSTSGASAKPFTSTASPDWKRRFDSAFSFAKRPIYQKGLGWNPEAAKDWASQVASKFSNEMALTTYTLQYGAALQFALNPIHSGGLGKTTIYEARDWALGTANTLTTRASLQDFIARYRLALDRARKPAHSGGQGMANAQEARDWALAKAKSISSYSVLQRHLETLPPPSATGPMMGSCFMDKLKSFFGAK